MVKTQKGSRLCDSFRLLRSPGFTVVELAIVIIVLGILTAIVIPQYNGIVQRANDTERKTDLVSLASQLEYYYAKQGAYPNLASLNNTAFRTGNKISAGDNDIFLADPKNTSVKTLSSTASPTNTYSYIPQPNSCISPTSNTGVRVGSGSFCTSYRLISRLEDLSDPDRDSTSTTSVAWYIKRNAASN